MTGTTRWRVLLGVVLLGAGAGCPGHPEDCPEPCPANYTCNYGTCVPIHDAGTEDVAADDAAAHDVPAGELGAE